MSIGSSIDGAIDAVGNLLHPVTVEAVKIYEDAKTELEGVEAKYEAKAKVVTTDLLAFVEHEAVAAKLALGKDRIAALDELHKASTEALAFLEQEKTRALSDVSALKAKVEALLETL